jgi:hypothetical protein
MPTSTEETFIMLAQQIRERYGFRRDDTEARQVARGIADIIERVGREIGEADAWDAYGDDL